MVFINCLPIHHIGLMMDIKKGGDMCKLLGGLCFLLSLPCLTYANELDNSDSVGIVSYSSSKIFISTTKKSLRNDLILICSQVTQMCESISSDLFSIEKKDEAVEDLATEKDIHTYYTFSNKSKEEIDIAIIYSKDSEGKYIVGFDKQYNVVIYNNDLKSIISTCTSNEGMHVYSDSKNIHLYYALGYNVEANCLEEVYK